MPYSDKFIICTMVKFINSQVQMVRNGNMQHIIVNSRERDAFSNWYASLVQILLRILDSVKFSYLMVW